MSASTVSRHFGINESTLRSVKKNEKAIRDCVTSCVLINAKFFYKSELKEHNKWKKVLSLWTEDIN